MPTDIAMHADASSGWLAGHEAALPAEPTTYVTFELGGQDFAVDVAAVREILDLQPIAALPNAPGDVLGMIDVRGEGVAVVDLSSRLGLRAEGGAAARMVVFELGSARTPIGVIADRVLGVAEIPDERIEPAPPTLTTWDARGMRGVARVGGRLTMLLDLDALFQTGAAGPFDFG